MGLAADCDDLESQQLPYSCGSGVVKLELRVRMRTGKTPLCN